MKKGQLNFKISTINKKASVSDYVSRITTLSMNYGFELVCYMKNSDFEVVGYGDGNTKNSFVVYVDYSDKGRKKSLSIEISGKDFSKYHFVSQWRKKECHLMFLEKSKTKYKFVESKYLKNEK